MSPENPLLRRSEDVNKYMVSYGGKLHVVLGCFAVRIFEPLFGSACVGHGS